MLYLYHKRKPLNLEGDKIVKKIFTKTFFRMLGTAIVGFGCGYLVDSVFFGINPIFAGVVEGVVLSLVGYASLKDEGIEI